MNQAMRRIFVSVVALSLTACSGPILEEEVVFEEAVIIEPILTEPVLRSHKQDCAATAKGIDDGIGGTGCEVS